MDGKKRRVADADAGNGNDWNGGRRPHLEGAPRASFPPGCCGRIEFNE